MGTKSYASHQLNYLKHVNMQEAHRNDYYANRVLFISKPSEVLTVIHDKMDHAKMASPCFANQIEAIDKLFELPITIIGKFGYNCITLPKRNFVFVRLYLGTYMNIIWIIYR